MNRAELARAVYIGQLHSQTDCAIATDQAGINGNTRAVTEVIHATTTRLPNPPRIGLEMLAWGHQLLPDLLFGKARQHINHIPLVGFHSKLGTVWKIALDTIITSVSDSLLLHPETLALLARENTPLPYVLIHNIAARSMPSESLYMDNTFLAIENAANSGDYDEMLEQTQRKEGVIPTFDIVHYLRDHRCLRNTTPQQWKKMCDALAACGPCIVHLPVGRQAYDSLDFTNITDQMWQLLAQTLHKHPTYVVVEYQPKNMLLGISPKDKKEIDHMTGRIAFLQQRNVLT